VVRMFMTLLQKHNITRRHNKNPCRVLSSLPPSVSGLSSFLRTALVRDCCFCHFFFSTIIAMTITNIILIMEATPISSFFNFLL
jgi:hypothetical protein